MCLAIYGGQTLQLLHTKVTVGGKGAAFHIGIIDFFLLLLGTVIMASLVYFAGYASM